MSLHLLYVQIERPEPSGTPHNAPSGWCMVLYLLDCVKTALLLALSPTGMQIKEVVGAASPVTLALTAYVKRTA